MKLGKHALRYFSRTGANASGLSTFTKGSLPKIKGLERIETIEKTSSYGTLASSLRNSFNLPHHRTKFKDMVIASYSTKSKGQDDNFPPQDNDRDSTELSAEERIKATEEYEKLPREKKEEFEKLFRENDEQFAKLPREEQFIRIGKLLEFKGSQDAKPAIKNYGNASIYDMYSDPKRLSREELDRMLDAGEFKGGQASKPTIEDIKNQEFITAILDVLKAFEQTERISESMIKKLLPLPPVARKKILEKQDRKKTPYDMDEILAECESFDMVRGSVFEPTIYPNTGDAQSSMVRPVGNPSFGFVWFNTFYSTPGDMIDAAFKTHRIISECGNDNDSSKTESDSTELSKEPPQTSYEYPPRGRNDCINDFMELHLGKDREKIEKMPQEFFEYLRRDPNMKIYLDEKQFDKLSPEKQREIYSELKRLPPSVRVRYGFKVTSPNGGTGAAQPNMVSGAFHGFDDKLKSIEEIIAERAEAAEKRAKTSKLGGIFKLNSPKVDTIANHDGDDPKAKQRDKNKESQDEKAEEDSSTKPSFNR